MNGLLVFWKLRKEHIDAAATAVDLNPKRLTGEDYEQIMERFIYELRRERGRWRTLLEDVIEAVLR